MVNNIRKTSNVIPLKRGELKKTGNISSTTEAPSPFALSAADPLKALQQRKSGLTEEQHLAILQRALEPFASEAKKRLPDNVKIVEKKVRTRMLQEGFNPSFANEAGDEAVTAILNSRSGK